MIQNNFFKSYSDYIKSKTIFRDKIKIVPNTPESLADFPTIIMRQLDESDNIQGKTINRLEHVSRIYYRVSIYTKPTIVDEKKYQSNQIIDELRKYTYDFFNSQGMNMDSDRPVDNIDLKISRREMIFSCQVASWNNSLYF